jgi:hypothetical protein
VVGFTSQNNLPGTMTQILAEVAGNGFTDSVSATYTSTSTVPEPMTLSMMGVGLLALGLVRRRSVRFLGMPASGWLVMGNCLLHGIQDTTSSGWFIIIRRRAWHWRVR